MSAAVAAVIAGWAAPSIARESIALPNVVGTEGTLNGVDTTGPGTLTIGNNQNINTNNDIGGGLTSDAHATATLQFTGNSTVTGFTGTTGIRFLTINGGAAASTVNFNGDVFSQTLNVTGTGNVNFNGNATTATNFAGDGFINLAANRTLTGALTTATANTGTLTLNIGSNVTGAVGGASGIRAINVAGNSSIIGAVQTLGLNLGTNTLNITGQLTTNAGGTISTTLASNTVFGHVIANNSQINAGGITVTPTVTGALTTGTVFKIVDAPAGTIGAPVAVVNNNPRYQFSGVPTTTGDVNILLTAAPLANLSTTPGALAVAPILDVNGASGSDLLTIQDAIAVLPNAAAINNALVQLAPGTTNLAAPWVASQTTRMFDDMWMARMDEIQDLCCDDACGTNIQPKPVAEQKCRSPNQHGSWWAKGFANNGQQNNVQNMNGYDTKAYGLMVAYDMALNEQTRVGFGGGYANTTVDGNNVSGRTKIDTYQVTGYFDHIVGTAFVQGAVTAGVDKYEGSRSIIFPGIDRTANAEYDGQQYSAIVSAGKHFAVNDLTVTPLASLRVSRISVDSYTEQGADAASLRVASQDYDFVQSGLGVKVERIMQYGSQKFSPEVHYRWLHDFRSTTMQQSAAFTGGGGTFSAKGIDQDRNLHNLGAGITFISCNCTNETWSLKGLYDYNWNGSDYSSHQVSILASKKF